MNPLNEYVIHFTDRRVVVCRFCHTGIPPKDPQSHYNCHHTESKKFPLPFETRQRIVEYISTLDLLPPKYVQIPSTYISALQVQPGWRCRHEGCNHCTTTEDSMRTHYRYHQKSVAQNFQNWEACEVQTWFEGNYKK